MPGFAIATATAVIVGQNLGAKKPDRAEEGVKVGLVFDGTVTFGVSIFYYVFADQLIWFFDPSGASVTTGAS